MKLVDWIKQEARAVRRLEQTDDSLLASCLDDAAKRIAELEAALRKINALIDSPARFNPEVQAVLDSVINTSDTKFANQK